MSIKKNLKFTLQVLIEKLRKLGVVIQLNKYE